MELLVGPVAHGDRQLGRLGVVEVAGDGAPEIEAGPAGGGDGAGVHRIGRVGAGRRGGTARAGPPHGGGELGAGRVVRAHEEHGSGGPRRSGTDRTERLVHQPDIPSPVIAVGREAFDEAGVLEHVEVMGQEIAGKVAALGQLLR